MAVLLNIDEEIAAGRKAAIEHFYRVLTGKNPPIDELAYYVGSEDMLERVYLAIKSAHYEAVARNEKFLPVSAVILAKDAEDSLPACLQSIKGLVSEVVVLEDAGTTDKTYEVCKDFGATVYKAGFSDFGSMRTINAHLATQPWILQLDTDEILCEEEEGTIARLVNDESVDIWGFPRRRWADLDMTKQVELEAYPDWQYRLFRNNRDIRYERRVHERVIGSDRVSKSESGVHIEHFQDVFKVGKKLVDSNNMYRDLYSKDLAEGVKHDGPAVASIDEEAEKKCC